MAQGPAIVEAALRAAVSERLGEARFGLWFGDGVRLGLSGDGDALEVRVPDPFFREWIQSHYTDSLLEAAEAVVGRPLRLSIQIRDEAEPPLGDVVEPGPAPHRARSRAAGARAVITIPLPGNPKAPLSFPTPSPSEPWAFLAVRAEPAPSRRIGPSRPKRMQTTSSVELLPVLGRIAAPAGAAA